MSAAASPQRDELLEAFWEEGLILFGDRVREEYALHTPIFIDLRHKLYEHLETLSALGGALHRRILELATPGLQQQVIGIPDTATPIALATALASHKAGSPIAYGQLRKKPANYPGGRSGSSSYMGQVDPAREITLLDDVMASGRTKQWSITTLAAEGLKVARILVVVDREQGGDAILGAEGCPAYSLYRVSEVIDYYERTGRIDAPTADAARDHVRKRRFE
jgi:orotate phosphoribosyltransferase